MRVLCVIGFALSIGCGIRSRAIVDAEEHWRNTPFQEFKKSGAEAFQRGEYRQAASRFSVGAQAAEAAGDKIAQARFLANYGGSLSSATDNRAALPVMIAARDLAAAAGDLATQQVVESNLSSVYSMTGAIEDAYIAANRGAALQPRNQVPETRTTMLLNFARGISRFRGVTLAAPVFSEALSIASARGVASLEADVLEIWGFEWMRTGELAAAEELLSRAWVIRNRIADRRLPLTEGKLASLFRRQGKISVARFWHNRVQASIDAGARLPFVDWAHFAEKAAIAEAAGDGASALVHFRQALEMVRQWRQRVPPADRIRLSSELSVNDLFDGYLRVAARAWRQTRNERLAAEMFAALQQHRAWSAQKAGATQASETLHSMARRLEGEWLAGNHEARFKLAAIRTEIAEKQSTDGRPVTRPAVEWKQPDEGAAVIAFWLHEEGSLVWLWTARGLETARIAPRGAVLESAEAFRKAVAKGEDPDSAVLLNRLFGGLSSTALRLKRWEIVADENLAIVPFAALRHKPDRYLVEDIEVHFVPNALSIKSQPRSGGEFLAVADPVFNTVDERRVHVAGQTVQASHWAFSMSRLPGTRAEAEKASGVWRRAGFRSTVLSGVESSEESVLRSIESRKPSVIHLATHTAAPAGEEQRPRLLLSLRADGSPGLLTAEDIAALDCSARVVVMSACQSSGAATVRGAGILGLTRAWLTAGAGQVVSTLWPVGDDTAAFYSEFHEALAAGGSLDAARALRETQLLFLRQQGHRAKPRYWAAHALLARR